jgi:hypothetical protein
MTDAATLLAQIEEACRRLQIAQTTFGRQAVNDGKFVTRLQQGGRVTLETVLRVQAFIESKGGPSAASLRSDLIRGSSQQERLEHNFRFYDNRQKYLMFVNTSSEKQMIVNRALEHLSHSQPQPPAIRMMDAGSGDGTAIARLLRGAHRQYPWLPFYLLAKEISSENVRLLLEKMPDRLQEHPATVLVITNLNYADAPWLTPSNPIKAGAMVWQEVALEGTTAGEFDDAIADLQPFLDRHWQVEIDEESGFPLHKTPAVLVIYRRDQRFVLDSILPRRGLARADFDFVLLSQPYRASAPIGFKAKRIVAPLVRALRPSGRLLGMHSFGEDPSTEIFEAIWPGEKPFTTRRDDLLREVREALGPAAQDFTFHELSDAESLFRYNIHILPTELDPKNEIGSSTLLAAWNAVSYVAQIDDRRLAIAMSGDRYIAATRDALRKHGGLWFNNETYIVSRRADLGRI